MHVEGFDSMDQMMAAMAASEDMANLTLTPGQIALRDDMGHTRYWARALPDLDLVIFGRAETTGFLQAAGSGFDPTENRERGYLTGTAYSADLPEGETGDTHVSQVVPINLRTFTIAETLGWPRYSELRHPDNVYLGMDLAAAERVSLGRD